MDLARERVPHAMRSPRIVGAALVGGFVLAACGGGASPDADLVLPAPADGPVPAVEV